MNITKLIYILVFLSFSRLLSAQQDVIFERISIDQGLSQGNVNAIIQDARGFMWFATQDGLNRFDGYKFTIFKPQNSDPNSISGNVIKSLYESKDGCIWAGTDGGGLSCYNPKSGKFTSFKNDPNDPLSLSNNSVYAIFEDADGQIWVGTFGGGVCVLNRETGNFVRYQNDPKDSYSLTGNAIRAIFEDKDGNIWIGVDGAGLNKFDKNRKRFNSYRHDPANPESLGSDIVLCVLVDSKGFFWVGSWAGGVSKFNPKNGKTIIYKNDPLDPKSLSSNENFSILEDRKGKIWICTRKGLDLLNEDGVSFTHFKNDPLVATTISFDIVIALFEDESGVMWVGTEGGGVCKVDLNKKQFYHYQNDYKNPKSLSHNEVTQIFEDSRGKYWIGTRSGGVNITELGSHEFSAIRYNPNTSNSLLSDNVQTVLEDRQGNYWFGTNGAGISRYNPSTGKFDNFVQNLDVPTDLSNNAIFGLVEDREGDIWISTYGGGVNRYSYKTNTFKRYTIDKNNQMKNVGLCLYIDSEGKIWCGTSGHGLIEYNKETDKFIYHENDPNNPNSICNNVVITIYEDADNALWIGTGGGGVDKYVKSEGKFYNINQKNGLASDMISGILSDSKKNMWITTGKGLTKYNPADSSVRNYDILDGLQGNTFTNNSSYKNDKGYLFFGGVNGFNFFHPDSIKDNEVLPKIIISDFKIFSSSVLPGDDFGVLENTITETSEIKLPYKYNKFSFEFSALHYSSPTKNQYKYMMVGFDKDWVTTTYDRRFASYTNLPGGDYTFRVIASNSDGKWNEEGVSLKITIVPPFWQTIWFYIIVALIVGAIIYLIFRYREKQARIEKINLQQKIDTAINEVEKQKLEIIEQNQELQKRQEEDKKRQWFNEGIAKFSDIIRLNKDNIEVLSMSILSNLIRYINAVQGGMYIINEEDEHHKYLELIASYAYNNERLETKVVEIGETLIGSVFVEKKVRRINNIPSGYTKIDSGLGQTEPKCLVFVPLRLDELIFGVLEISSIQEITDYEIDFVEKIAEVVTSQLFTARITQKTTFLLSQSQQQAEELRAQEEEARQNIEEMQANREEALRLKSEAMGYLNSMNHSTIRADFDLDGKLIYGNVRFLDCFGYKSKEAVEMHVTDFFKEEDRAVFQNRWDALIRGSKHIEETINHKTKNGNILLLSTFTAVKDIHGSILKVLYIGLDIDQNYVGSTKTKSSCGSALDKIIINVELDKSGAIIHANTSFAQLMGFDVEDLKDVNITEFLVGKEKDNFKNDWEKVLKGEMVSGEYSRKLKDNTIKWYKCTLVPDIVSDEVSHVYYYAFDITDKRIEIENSLQRIKTLESEYKKQLAEAEKRIKDLEKNNG